MEKFNENFLISKWADRKRNQIRVLYDAIEAEFLKYREICNFYDYEEKFDSGKYDSLNACTSLHLLIFDTINWTEKFHRSCHEKESRVLKKIKNDWIKISKGIRYRLPDLCEDEADLLSILS